ncbi:MAG: 3-methyl-2-oxobutanoate hydroxymethyltransferase [Deltaproteobacteria bacterium]|nr:3-methyl-2-oxobutanoate hydroxymethyltransferase [Deltaproteobacteria bacterium]
MKKITIPELLKKKSRAEKISMLTAYDYSFAKILDQNGIDILLVGDSLGMVVQGRRNTLAVTLEEMIYHSRCVSRATRQAHLVCDMPFLSYQASLDEAVKNCGLVMKKGHAESVKLEGGEELAPLIARLKNVGIPVMGHIGLKPTHVHLMGGYKIQGRDAQGERQLLNDAKALEKAGIYALVLEGIPAKLAAKISKSLKIPTIGIGSGAGCDGQVLVIYDLLGLYQDLKPKFVRRYAELHQTVSEAIGNYIRDVQSGKFPSEEESF